MKNLTAIIFSFIYVCDTMAGIGNRDYTLPIDFPERTVTVNDNPDSGYIFLSSFGLGNQASLASYIMILDNTGFPVFFRKMRGPTMDFKIQPNGLLSYIEPHLPNWDWVVYTMDNSYTIVDSFVVENYLTDSHDFQIMPNGNVILLAKDYRIVDLSQIIEGGQPAARIEGCIIQELDQYKNVVFEWSSFDHFDFTDALHMDLTAQVIDYVHPNAIEFDFDGNILLSCRHLDEITKIDRQTGEIIWRMGGLNNQFTFTNENMDFEHLTPTPFCHQHDIRRLDNGNITIYDNGNFKNPNYSRAAEYQLDEINMTAALVWEYRHPPDMYSDIFGNAQRLPNGNTMIGWAGDSLAPALIESRPDCTKSFELSLPQLTDFNGNRTGLWSYRAFRFDWQGTADKPYLWADTLNDQIILNFAQFGDSSIVQYYIYQGEFSDSLLKIDSTLNNSFEISGLFSGETYFFRVSSLNGENNESLMSNIITYTPSNELNVSHSLTLPYRICLDQNYPNPFNAVTMINYDLPDDGMVNITIYDIRGRVVRTLIDKQQTVGSRSIQWNATNDVGAPVPTGIYLYTFQAVGFRQTKKMILLK